MAKPAKPVAVSIDFPGLVTNVDPRDLPAGAAEDQVNITCVQVGELRVRLGMRETLFDSDTTEV